LSFQNPINRPPKNWINQPPKNALKEEEDTKETHKHKKTRPSTIHHPPRTAGS
jgi:hypothetical protein